MAVRPSTPEIITVNSEALQTQIRDLLPSQNGFGSELQASNVITPIIDLTAAAEGSGLPVSLQQAVSFGSQTAFNANGTTVTLVNSPGFYRVLGSINVSDNAGNLAGEINVSDGLTTKTIYDYNRLGNGGGMIMPFDFIVFLGPGETLAATSNSTALQLSGSTRQVATGDGTLVQPNGFPL